MIFMRQINEKQPRKIEVESWRDKETGEMR
jgi:hypothetical protein